MKTNPANSYRNSPLYATYTAVMIKALFDLQDRSRVNLAAMLSWSFEFENKGFFEGFRALSTNGVDKPVLNIFRMALMSGERVTTSSAGQIPLDEMMKNGVRQAPDVDAMATKAAHEAAVMLWNYHDDDLPADSADVQVTIAGIPAGVKEGAVGALSDRRHAQQFLHRVEKYGISSDADAGAVRANESGRTAGASYLS